MDPKSQIVIALDRPFDANDEKSILRLRARWLVYNVKVLSKRSKAEIQLFHTKGAKPDLLKELNELFPNEHLTEM